VVNHSKDEMELLVKQGFSSYKIANYFNISQTTAMYWLKKYRLKTIQSVDKIVENRYCSYCNTEIDTNGKYKKSFCNSNCCRDYKAVQFGKLWVEKGPTVLSKTIRTTGIIRGKARRYVFIYNNYKCCKCKWTYDFDDSSLPPLECSHVNNDFSDNRFENIELLCPNCHAIKTRLKPIKNGNGRWSNNADSRNYKDR
jgi:5-methylcytosine-specific restriction endonuclease McrA